MIGNGNVALDVARMLVLDTDELAPTDTADHALEVLARSRVREVVVAGRRGPAQAAFTNPELLELGELSDADVIVDGAELERALAVHDQTAEQGAERTPQRGDPALLCRAGAHRGPAQDRAALPALAGGAARQRRRSRGGRRVRAQRARGRRQRRPACPTHRRARDDRRGPRLPRDRLSRHPASGRPLRRSRRRDSQRRRPGHAERKRRAPAGRVCRRVDQARTIRRDRDEQEGRPGDRRCDPRRPLGGQR